MLPIVAQQISITVALVLYDRLTAALDRPPTPVGVLRLDLDQLRALGMSHSKAAYLHHLADAVVDGNLAIDALHAMDDDDVITALTRVKASDRGVPRCSSSTNCGDWTSCRPEISASAPQCNARTR
ncbi:hypothetical protein ACLQ2Q_13415 [Microbacterium sp. DT81.1]|uniref:hypothetical protein n=1 Tax=Microbacterium sp. DT81.1 TaxID=3393413 RepID=UPI003CEF3A1F